MDKQYTAALPPQSATLLDTGGTLGNKMRV